MYNICIRNIVEVQYENALYCMYNMEIFTPLLIYPSLLQYCQTGDLAEPEIWSFLFYSKPGTYLALGERALTHQEMW